MGAAAVQVGDANADENVLPSEALMPEQYVTSKQFARPVIEINATSGGSDLIGEAVAAFASIALLFREEPGSEDFSNAMTKHARQLYEWMKDSPGTMYSAVHPMLARTYPSQVRPDAPNSPPGGPDCVTAVACCGLCCALCQILSMAALRCVLTRLTTSCCRM